MNYLSVLGILVDLPNLEWDVHCELGAVGAIEGAGALGPEDGVGGLRARRVRAAAHLHPLLHNWKE